MTAKALETLCLSNHRRAQRRGGDANVVRLSSARNCRRGNRPSITAAPMHSGVAAATGACVVASGSRDMGGRFARGLHSLSADCEIVVFLDGDAVSSEMMNRSSTR